MAPQPQIDQDEIVQLIRLREPDGLNYLYDHYSGALFGIISRIIMDESVSEEVLQDAFIKFWDKIDQYDPNKGRFFTWMANISRNLAIDRLRSKELKKAGKTDPIENIVTGIEDRGEELHVDGIGVADLLKTLREEERLIMVLVYFRGYTQSEVADEYNIPLGTVKTRLRMALKNMKKLLKVTD